LKEQHRKLVEKLLVEAGAQRRRFKRALISQLKIDPEALGSLATLKMAPDGYLIDHERAEVICYEVETTSSIDEGRLVPYVDWWWYLDDLGWNLRLVIVRGYGCHGTAFEIDLRTVSLTWDIENPSFIVGKVSPRLLNKEKRVAS
jgi:hypothetical protein